MSHHVKSPCYQQACPKHSQAPEQGLERSHYRFNLWKVISSEHTVHKVCTVLLPQTCDWSVFQNVLEAQAGLTLEVWLHQFCVESSKRESWSQASSVSTGVPPWTTRGLAHAYQLCTLLPKGSKRHLECQNLERTDPWENHPALGEGLGQGILDLGYKERSLEDAAQPSGRHGVWPCALLALMGGCES